jgi:hypothetical protein
MGIVSNRSGKFAKESSIVNDGVGMAAVRRQSERRTTHRKLLPLEKIKQLFSPEPGLSPQRHQSSLGQVAIVLRNYGAATRNGIVKNKMAARGVIEDEAIVFEKRI